MTMNTPIVACYNVMNFSCEKSLTIATAFADHLFCSYCL